MSHLHACFSESVMAQRVQVFSKPEMKADALKTEQEPTRNSLRLAPAAASAFIHESGRRSLTKPETH
jgi:hypothetical protein